MTEIIITDVTRFKPGSGKLCVAGVTLDGRTCIRPMMTNGMQTDYLTHAICKQYNILPGMRVSANFTEPRHLENPHHEDRTFDKFKVHGATSANEFEAVLYNSLSDSVASGFGVTSTSKVIAAAENPARSIITIRPQAGSVRVIEDKYNPGRVRINFSDAAGVRYSFLSITDLGLYDFVGNPETRKMGVEETNALLQRTDRVYLRVGLSRLHSSHDGRDGYWLQVNGVYSFPEYSEIIRSY